MAVAHTILFLSPCHFPSLGVASGLAGRDFTLLCFVVASLMIISPWTLWTSTRQIFLVSVPAKRVVPSSWASLRLAHHPDLSTDYSRWRLIDGNYTYLELVEQEIGALRGWETGLIAVSAFETNVAISTALSRRGDIILYDKQVHASTHVGMKQSLATQRMEFPHNDQYYKNSPLSSNAWRMPLWNTLRHDKGQTIPKV